ncbi:hypothetical protein RB653_001726 [Dictyostelium firmibasis]|uniref:Sulfiredoxin n=1 Tax=Dictyostelium firmibasis TaxID=79012 RepID=A0AAN7YRK9_9MYCE
MSVYTQLTSVTEMPMSVIHRPLPSELDEEKVLSLMETIKSGVEIPPIDVNWVKGRDENNNYYFSFGGCHRYEATKRLNMKTIRARIIKSTPNDIKVYLGSSCPDFK